jgi:hypothetical protein
MPFATLLVVLGFALVHLFGGSLRLIGAHLRGHGLSAAGGVAVAYVFLHIMPELAAHQSRQDEDLPTVLAYLELHIWILALAGLVIFYGLEHMVRASRAPDNVEEAPRPAVFALHIGAFAAYNALIGYLTFEREPADPVNLLLYFIAFGLHLLANDFSLRREHEQAYDTYGCWILAAAVIVGWALGLVFQLPQHALSVPFAILAGGIVLNVLKEELPEERRSRFGTFALGTGLYTVLLLAAS